MAWKRVRGFEFPKLHGKVLVKVYLDLERRIDCPMRPRGIWGNGRRSASISRLLVTIRWASGELQTHQLL